MTEITAESKPETSWRTLPRNVWAASLTSFFMDVSSEMVINILPLFLSNVLGVKTNIIGLIECIAEATASLLKVFSGWLSDKLRARKWLAVADMGSPPSPSHSSTLPTRGTWWLACAGLTGSVKAYTLLPATRWWPIP